MDQVNYQNDLNLQRGDKMIKVVLGMGVGILSIALIGLAIFTVILVQKSQNLQNQLDQETQKNQNLQSQVKDKDTTISDFKNKADLLSILLIESQNAHTVAESIELMNQLQAKIKMINDPIISEKFNQFFNGNAANAEQRMEELTIYILQSIK